MQKLIRGVWFWINKCPFSLPRLFFFCFFLNYPPTLSHYIYFYLHLTFPGTNYPGYNHHLKLLTKLNVAYFHEEYVLICPMENYDSSSGWSLCRVDKKKRFIFWPQDITYKMIPSSYEEIKLEPCIEAQLIHILIVPNHQCHPWGLSVELPPFDTSLATLLKHMTSVIFYPVLNTLSPSTSQLTRVPNFSTQFL